MDLRQPGTVMMKTPFQFMSDMKLAEVMARSESKILHPMIVKDRQQALQRFKWALEPGTSGLEFNFDSLMLESLLFERGIIGSGEVEPGVLDIFPVAWSGGIDRYRRMRSMRPIFPTGTDDKGKILEAAFDKIFDIVYIPFKVDDRVGDKYGAICLDYTAFISQTGINPRSNLQKELVQEMSNLYNISLINLVNSTAMAVYRIGDADQKDSIEQELKNLYADMLKGKWYQVFKTTQEMQDLTNPASYNGQAYWETFNSLDNLRMGMLGLVNNGTFNKKERKLEGESNVEAGNADLVAENSLQERMKFANALNSIYGTNISVEFVGCASEEEGEEESEEEEMKEEESYDLSESQ